MRSGFVEGLMNAIRNPLTSITLSEFIERARLTEEALSHLNEAVRLRPDATEWRYHLAAGQWGASTAPQNAPVDYLTSFVRQLRSEI